MNRHPGFSTALVAAFCGGMLWLTGVPLTALPMGEREISHFEREVLRVCRELFMLKGEERGEDFILSLDRSMVREVFVKKASLIFEGIPVSEKEAFKRGNFDFELLKKLKAITVEASIETSAIQDLIDRELSRQKPERLIFSRISVQFLDGKAKVSGKMDLRKIPGNPLAFLPQSLSSFDATVAVKMEGRQLAIDVIEAQANGQPMTPELRSQLLSWLNPLWDFSNLPYSADLEELRLTSGGISFKGYLFGR